MLRSDIYKILSVTGVAVALVAGSTGCRNLPGSPGAQGATIGGVGGAAAGAAIGGSEHRLLGALLGGAIGAGGGYLIGANSDRITGHDRAGAEQSVQRAQTRPATSQEAMNARTADINNDGFVTMDEVVAMRQAGFSDQQMIDRLRATGQVFELSVDQKNYLRTHGVDEYVVNQMENLNREARDRLMTPAPTGSSTGVIGQPPAYPPTTVPPPPPAPRY